MLLGLTLFKPRRLYLGAMQQIINRKVYDTESSEPIAKYGSIEDKSDFHALAETLYKDPDGEYFLHCQGGAATQYAKQVRECTTYGEELQLLTREEAFEWCEKRSIAADIVLEWFADLLENVENSE